MNISRYIKKLLPEHETVIFPGLGAFVSSYQSAQIDVESGQIVPPSKTVTFDPKIRHDDGLLAGQIAEDEHISQSEAQKKIKNERERILYRLDKGEEVILGSLGVLFVNEKQEISFKLSDGSNLLFDAFGLEATSLKNETESSPEEQVLAVHSTKTEKPVKKEVSEPQAHEKEYQGKEYVPEFITSMNEPDISPQKRRRGWLWFILFLIIITVAGTFFLIINQEEPPVSMNIIVETPENEETEELPAVVPEDTVKADSAFIPGTDASFETAETEIDTTGYIKTNPTKFYLIGGSFTKAKNADKYFQRMKKEGFNPFHLGKKGNFYLVGIKIFNNEIEAYGAQYNFLEKYPDSGIWVYIPD